MGSRGGEATPRDRLLAARLRESRHCWGACVSPETPPARWRASADESTATKARVDHELSRTMPSITARLQIWRARSRSTTTIVPPQRGQGHEANGVRGSTWGASSDRPASARRQRGRS